MRHRIARNETPALCDCCGTYGSEDKPRASVCIPIDTGKSDINLCGICLDDVLSADGVVSPHCEDSINDEAA